jgi:glyoxylase-like metal-dependent hydrolase (beta-lactamase superfamily II)
VSEAPELEAALWGEGVRLGIPFRPVLVHTGWNVGPVAAFLFPEDPVTLIDAGYDHAEGRAGIQNAFRVAGLRVDELKRIVVTHAHSDHIGCSAWLQEQSGCEVLMQREDAERMSSGDDWRTVVRELFGPLGVSEEAIRRFFDRDDDDGWPARPEVTVLEGGEVVEGGGRRLRVEHFAGHTPGHLLVIDEQTGAVFDGDYLLASTPTNAGLYGDPGQPLGRLPMLRLYNEGLERMARIDAPVVLPSHGPPIHDHAKLIARRLEKTGRRTEHVLEALGKAGEVSPLDLVFRMYGERVAREPWGFISDVAGRLDLLAAEGRAGARKGEDGVWCFSAIDDSNRPTNRLTKGGSDA